MCTKPSEKVARDGQQTSFDPGVGGTRLVWDMPTNRIFGVWHHPVTVSTGCTNCFGQPIFRWNGNVDGKKGYNGGIIRSLNKCQIVIWGNRPKWYIWTHNWF